MPTYSYASTASGHRFDAQQSFDDAALTECPECTGRLRKLFGAVGVVFKGSGFYRTDSRARNGAALAGSNGSSGSNGSNGSSGSNGAAKGESSKPEAKKAEPTGGAAKAAAPA